MRHSKPTTCAPAHERVACLNALVRQLEKRLSELLGEQTCQQMGTIDKR
jgi:hypothetical protein